MDKQIIKIKNEEILNYKDLKIVCKYFIKAHSLNSSVTFADSPYYDFDIDEIGCSNVHSADWFVSDYKYMHTGVNMKPFLSKEEILNLKKTYQVPNNSYLINFLLLNAMFHELRHAKQQDILKNKEKFASYDDLFLRSLLQSNVKKSRIINSFYHDQLYHEYDADLHSALAINLFNQKYFDSKEIEKFNQFAAYKLLRGYLSKNKKNISNPIKNVSDIYGSFDQMYQVMESLKLNKEALGDLIKSYKGYEYYDLFEYLEEKNDYNESTKFFDKLLIGNELKIEELQRIKDIYTGDSKTFDLEKTLRK